MNEIGQPSPEEIANAAEELNKPLSKKDGEKAREHTPAQMFALADHFEQQGLQEDAAAMRAMAQSELAKPQQPGAYHGEAFQQKIEAEIKARQEEIARQPKVPRPAHNPK